MTGLFKKLSFGLLGMVVLVGAALSFAGSGSGFVINGKVDGIPDQKVYLQQLVKGERAPQDFLEAEIVDGKFEFKGQLNNAPVELFLMFEQPAYRSWDSIIADNSNMSVTVSVSEKRGETSMLDFDVKGSTSNDEYLALMTDLDKRFGGQMRENNEAFEALNLDWTLAEEEWAPEVLAQVKELRSGRKEIFKAQYVYLKQLAENNMGQLKSLLAMRELSNARPSPFASEEERKVLFSKLGKSLQMSQIAGVYSAQMAARAERERLAAEVSVGSLFKDFTQNDVDGNPVKASQLLKEGQYLFLDFWASWCGPCREENPHVLEAYEMYHDKGFDVLAISLDEDRDSWLEAIEEDGMPWTHVSDLKGWENEASKMYGVGGIPMNFLLDDKGTIVASGLRGKKLRNKLAELLDK